MACIAGVVSGWLGAAKGSNTAAAGDLQQNRTHVTGVTTTQATKRFVAAQQAPLMPVRPHEWTGVRVTYAHAGTHTTTMRALRQSKRS